MVSIYLSHFEFYTLDHRLLGSSFSLSKAQLQLQFTCFIAFLTSIALTCGYTPNVEVFLAFVHRSSPVGEHGTVLVINTTKGFDILCELASSFEKSVRYGFLIVLAIQLILNIFVIRRSGFYKFANTNTTIKISIANVDAKVMEADVCSENTCFHLYSKWWKW